ncbi:MAG: two-component regulator propeller domain-containing protein [Thermoanaerobaculales bacterium]
MFLRRIFPAGISVLTVISLLGAAAGASATRRSRQTEFSHVTTDDGLLHSNVYAIAQDRTGFMWFGTEAGLMRYDGYGLTPFVSDPDDATAISTNGIAAILLDSAGVMWVGSWGGGLYRFDDGTELFASFTHDPSDPLSVPDDRIQVVFEDRDKTLWTGSFSGGLSRFEAGSGSFVTYRHDPANPESLSADRVWAICGAEGGALWIGTEQGLDRLDRETGTLTSFRHDPQNPKGLPAENIRALAIDGDGTVWVGTWRGLGSFDPGLEVFHPVPGDTPAAEQLRKVPVNVIFQASDGALWVGTAGNGLFSIDGATGAVEQFVHHPDRPGSLSSNDVRALYEDRSRVLWIGTRGGGIDRLDLKPPKFDRVRHDPSDASSVSNGWVSSFLEDSSGRLWVGTSAGLDRHDESNGGFVHFRPDASDPTTLPNPTVQYVYEDRSGVIWVGTWNGGLSRFDRKSQSFDTFRHDPADPESLSDNRVSTILEDSEGTLWVGTARGLNRFNRQRGSFDRLLPGSLDGSDSLGDDVIWVLFEDRQGQLWVGTEVGGLVRFDRDSSELVRYLPVSGDASSLSSRHVLALFEDAEGTLWIGTTNGLNARAPGAEKFVRLGSEVGLPAGMVYGILGDDDGHLWISTSRGLSRFDPHTGEVRNYTARDGLHGITFRSGACLKGGDGRLYFGGNNGYTVFHPSQVADNPHAPPVVLSSFRRFDEKVTLDRPLSKVETINLSHQDNFFSLGFAALDYTDPLRNRFRYILEGFDREWNKPGTRRFASYTNVSPGRYVLKVQACNSDGVWNEKGLELAIRIIPPFWRTWWFRILALASIILGVITLLKVKLAAERRRQEVLEQQVGRRTEQLRTANDRISEQNIRLENLSRTDPVTGLKNRRVLEERLLFEMAILRRGLDAGAPASTRGFAVFLFDIDRFKDVNDTYGHEVGDQVLRAVGGALESTLREVDLAVRWGGDEFVVLARGHDHYGVKSLAERLQMAITRVQVPRLDEVTLALTASGGFVAHPLAGRGLLSSEEWPLLVEAADRLMYVAKARGRARTRGIISRAGESSALDQREILKAIIDNADEDLPDGVDLVETLAVTPGTNEV